MVDIGAAKTESVSESLEERMRAEYEKARRDVKKKAAVFFKQFEAEDKAKLAEVEAGKLPRSQYERWRKEQMLVNSRWKKMRDQIAADMTRLNQSAVGMVREELPDVFAENANFEQYMVETGHGTNYSFTLYDREAVENIVSNDPELYPLMDPQVNVGKDLRWNKQQINSHITQGLLQGDSIPHLAERLAEALSASEAVAVRIARTSMTAAHNAGRQAAWDRFDQLGIKRVKRWNALKDFRTRNSHIELDGKTVPLDGLFTSKLGSKMKHPGDTSHGAVGADLYNCRCRASSEDERPVADRKERVKDPVTGRYELISKMTYKEWLAWKTEQAPDAFEEALKEHKRKGREKAKERRQNERKD